MELRFLILYFLSLSFASAQTNPHELPILIATDVAARGIDVNDLTHVFHFALPDDPSYYTHRSGRTARAGKKGISLVFLGGRDQNKLRRLENDLRIKFRKVDIPEVQDIANLRLKNWALQVIEQSAQQDIPEDIFQEVAKLWAGLSKEELIGKLLAFEGNKLNLQDSQSLNIHHGKDKGGRGGDRKKKFGGKKPQGGGPSFKAKRKPFKHGHQRPNAKRKKKGGGGGRS